MSQCGVLGVELQPTSSLSWLFEEQNVLGVSVYFIVVSVLHF